MEETDTVKILEQILDNPNARTSLEMFCLEKGSCKIEDAPIAFSRMMNSFYSILASANRPDLSNKTLRYFDSCLYQARFQLNWLSKEQKYQLNNLNSELAHELTKGG